MVTQAKASDVAALESLAREFYESSKVLRVLDIQKFCAFWEAMIGSGNGVIFILMEDGVPRGGIGGMIYEEIYCGERIAVELFWFVGKESRGDGVRLYKRLEQWAREQGCVEIRMAHLVDSMPQKVADFYERVGYSKIETLYAKRLAE